MGKPILEVRLSRLLLASALDKKPARDFLRALTVEDRKAIGTDIKTVQFGWPLGMPLVRKMMGGERNSFFFFFTLYPDS